MESDVKCASGTTSVQLVPLTQRTRVKGVQIAGTAGTVTLRSNGAAGTVVAVINGSAPDYLHLPSNGLLFEQGVYAEFSAGTVTFVSIFYA
jgi:hypothetical protein